MPTTPSDPGRALIVPIRFLSIDRIEGKEGKSKLLHPESRLYQFLSALKAAIRRQFSTAPDRMDLHIELVGARDDDLLRTRTEALDGRTIDLADETSWDYLGRAFVLRVPEVDGVTAPHITVVHFGEHPRPPLDELLDVVSGVAGVPGGAER